MTAIDNLWAGQAEALSKIKNIGKGNMEISLPRMRVAIR